MKKIDKTGLCGIAAFVGIGLPIALWIGCEVFHRWSSDPGDAKTWREYRADLPTPLWVGRAEKDGQAYFAAAGPVRVPVATSNSPMYIFDAHGMMIDWTLDSGDNNRFQTTWPGYSWERMDINELDKLMASSAR